MPKNKNGADAFAYDDAFRTMEGECDDILIPFVNYVFGEHYTNDAVIKRMRNEHFIASEGKDKEKRVTDSHFEITENGVSKRYHIECESKPYDNSLLIRFLEYDTSTAMDDLRWEGNNLIVRFPQSGLLLLRNSNNMPKEANIIMETPGGAVSYPVRIIKVSDFSIDEIFEKRLYLLIPFYIFNFEKDLKHIEADEARVNSLAEFYNKIVERLTKDRESDHLSALSFGVIICMAEKVFNKLAHKHETVREKVGVFMGGKVLDIPIIRAYHQGKDEGRAEGIFEGRNEGREEVIADLIRRKAEKGKSMETIAEELEMQVSEIRDIYESVCAVRQ